MIALPPSAGATNDTATCALAATTVGCAGALGTVLGIATADAGDATPVPSAFVALTVQVYDRPFDNAPTTMGEVAPVAEPVAPPFDGTQPAV